MKLEELSKEVYLTTAPIAAIDQEHLDFLVAQALDNTSGKCRLLLHGSAQAALHQMLIVHSRGYYIQPHINEISAKSFHVIKGAMTCLIFNEQGQAVKTYRLGESGSSRPFLVRLSESRFHTLVIESETVVFLETIQGPFGGTVYAPWAPAPEAQEAREYFQNLCAMTGAV